MSALMNFILFFAYISNASFPDPLTPDEEQKYFDEYQNGSKYAKNILIERNLRLVAHIVKKYSLKDSEDLISIGTIGLIKAINTYNSNKGVRLATYAARCIDNEILMHIRTNKKYSGDISLQSPVGVDNDGNEIKLEDKLFDNKSNIDEQINLKLETNRIRDLLKSFLEKREKIIISLRYGLINGIEKTQREIADMLGISRSYVSRIEKKVLKKLKTKMKEKLK